LQLNHTLYSLVLRDNNITEVGLKLLDASLNVNSTLKHISLLTHTPKDKMLPHTTLANEIEKKADSNRANLLRRAILTIYDTKFKLNCSLTVGYMQFQLHKEILSVRATTIAYLLN